MTTDEPKNTEIELDENLENKNDEQDGRKEYNLEPMIELISMLEGIKFNGNIEDYQTELSDSLSDINENIYKCSKKIEKYERYEKIRRETMKIVFYTIIVSSFGFLFLSKFSFFDIFVYSLMVYIPTYALSKFLNIIFSKRQKTLSENNKNYHNEKDTIESHINTIKISQDNFKNSDSLDNSEKYAEYFQNIYTEIENKRAERIALNRHIENAQQALANSLENADNHIEKYSNNAKTIGLGAISLIIIDVLAIFYLWLNSNMFFLLLQKLGAWALTLYSFPILIMFSIAVTLLRHQKKLLDEVRHYSSEKRQIELYSGLLKASQHVADGLNDRQESVKYVKETFDKIRDHILSEQPHTNTAGSAVEKEEYSSSLEPLIKVISDMIAKSEVKK